MTHVYIRQIINGLQVSRCTRTNSNYTIVPGLLQESPRMATPTSTSRRLILSYGNPSRNQHSLRSSLVLLLLSLYGRHCPCAQSERQGAEALDHSNCRFQERQLVRGHRLCDRPTRLGLSDALVLIPGPEQTAAYNVFALPLVSTPEEGTDCTIEESFDVLASPVPYKRPFFPWHQNGEQGVLPQQVSGLCSGKLGRPERLSQELTPRRGPRYTYNPKATDKTDAPEEAQSNATSPSSSTPSSGTITANLAQQGTASTKSLATSSSTTSAGNDAVIANPQDDLTRRPAWRYTHVPLEHCDTIFSSMRSWRLKKREGLIFTCALDKGAEGSHGDGAPSPAAFSTLQFIRNLFVLHLFGQGIIGMLAGVAWDFPEARNLARHGLADVKIIHSSPVFASQSPRAPTPPTTDVSSTTAVLHKFDTLFDMSLITDTSTSEDANDSFESEFNNSFTLPPPPAPPFVSLGLGSRNLARRDSKLFRYSFPAHCLSSDSMDAKLR
ncbi:hypothetical protein K438DRAFT_1752406 [Mycena galopus ATCC 62051]|nr:hypothetical protein K438DRAFT_1752406 [Mycena galopus ATCC 62051]